MPLQVKTRSSKEKGSHFPMIDKLIFWNIRSVKTHKAFGRLTDLNRRHQYSFISLMDSFQEASNIDQYARKLGLINFICNSSTKMWIFLPEDWNVVYI